MAAVTSELVSAKLDGWPSEVIIALAATARYGLHPDPALIAQLRQLTSLLPPQDLTTLTRGKLRSKVPAAQKVFSWSKERFEALRALRTASKPRLDDEAVLAVWEVRAKVDLSIRRTRFRDCYTCYRNGGSEDLFWRRCEALPGFDLITVCNLLNASWVLSTDSFDWFEFWQSLGAFSDDVAHYTAVAKVVNDLLKKFPSVGLPWMRLVECGVMTGYRNPPFPGFNVVDETKKLAEGGGEHGLSAADSLAVFSRIAEVTLDTEGENVAWKGFRDYIVEGDWETSGSSSVGIVKWEYGGETGHFKARKNLVPDVVDLEQLATDCMATDDQVNKAIVKSELGKLRMAVASDMHTYLKMSWITRLLGGCYKAWPGSTIEEDVFQQTDRMLDMLRAICAAWNLPFDYAAFDHQPTTAELLAIVKVLIRCARRNVGADHMAEFDQVAASVVEGFSRSTLSVRDESGVVHKFPVTGGVMSGLRWTTILGNAWNTVMTVWVAQTLNALGVDTSDVKRWIRGDDSAIVADTYAKVLLFREGYEAIGALGSDGKFGIHRGASEFLRVWYDRTGCHGYAARAVPGLLQRKPWSSAPWEEESTMSAIYDTCRTLRRRGADCRRVDGFWRAVKQVWSQRRHVSTNWLQVPKNLGGLGVEPWDGETMPVSRWPVTDTLNLRVTNATEWRARKLEAEYSKFLPISVSEAGALAARLLAKKVASDDVPSLNSLYRENAQKPEDQRFSKQKAGWNIPGSNELLIQTRLLAETAATKGAFRAKFDSHNDDSYGRHSELAQKWADVNEVMRLRRGTTMGWFRDNYPDFAREVRRLERRGLARWEALDWTFGTTPLSVTSQLHPALTGLLHRAVTSVVKGFIGRVKLRARQLTQLVCQATNVLERALLSSPLSQVVYSW